jgi:hypothetical protein
MDRVVIRGTVNRSKTNVVWTASNRRPGQPFSLATMSTTPIARQMESALRY